MSSVAKHAFGVFIGRFQPLHDAHVAVMLEALSLVDTLIIVIGSSYRARHYKNPFTFAERERMILAALVNQGIARQRLVCVGVSDYYYQEERWLNAVQTSVDRVVAERTAAHTASSAQAVLLVGHEKDESSYYLHSFPQWTYWESTVQSPLNATDIRQDYLLDQHYQQHLAEFPEVVHQFLEEFRQTPEYMRLRQMLLKVETTAHSPMVLWSHAVLRCGNYVLLSPASEDLLKPQYMLPGLPLWPKDTAQKVAWQAVLTAAGYSIPKHVLQQRSQLFDYPERGQLGHCVAWVSLYTLDQEQLPLLFNGAAWYSLAELRQNPEHLIDDHLQIIEYFWDQPEFGLK